MNNTVNVGVISLGCDKNRVDTEKMVAVIKQKFNIVNDIEQADVVIVNTCAFLEKSRKEAVDTIFDVNAYRKMRLKKIIVTGCLPQLSGSEFFGGFTEIDGILGISDYNLINDAISDVLSGKRINYVSKGNDGNFIKRVVTTKPYAYLKIAEGCSNCCTYCLIPKIRGKYRSFDMNLLIEEAKALGDVRELILVAQDITRYGEDLGKNRLVELINELTKLPNIDYLRLLYCYPERITDQLINTIRDNKKVIKYIDIPMQHASDRILKLMNRQGTFDAYLTLVNKLKSEIPNIAIRSTFITGFPSESQDDFEILCDFLRKAKLFNAGFFAYSREEGTKSYSFDGQIDGRTKYNRIRKLYSLQNRIAKSILSEYKGKTLEVLVDGYNQDSMLYEGRAYFSAPDIDTKVLIFSEEELPSGSRVNVKIRTLDKLDLIGDFYEFT